MIFLSRLLSCPCGGYQLYLIELKKVTLTCFISIFVFKSFTLASYSFFILNKSSGASRWAVSFNENSVSACFIKLFLSSTNELNFKVSKFSYNIQFNNHLQFHMLRLNHNFEHHAKREYLHRNIKILQIGVS